ncbi:MAG: putative ABC transport system ATP-binding protein [Oleiphilaceae bacterium]|jgi:putative ABC transport system ATP-binding protein
MTNISDQPALLLQDVKYGYQKDQALILDIPFWELSAGSSIFLHGASGSGKSTLLNLLSGLLLVNTGVLSIAGTCMSELSTRQRDRFRAKHIGVVFQQFNLIPYLSVMDNVLLAAHFVKSLSVDIEKKASELFAQLNISESLYQKKAMHLSIGQQQRVAIVRALLNSPEILLVDEPTSALDTDNRDAFMCLLLNVVKAQGASLVFVSHDLNLARYFETTLELDAINCVQTHNLAPISTGVAK